MLSLNGKEISKRKIPSVLPHQGEEGMWGSMTPAPSSGLNRGDAGAGGKRCVMKRSWSRRGHCLSFGSPGYLLHLGGGGRHRSVPRGRRLSFEHVVPCLQDFPLTRTPGHYRFRLVTADTQGPLRGSEKGPWKTLL